MTEPELARARRLASEMLMEQLADDLLELEDFERYVDRVNAAETVQEIADMLGEVAAARARTRVALPRPFPTPVPTQPRDSGSTPDLRTTQEPGSPRRRSSVVFALQDGAGRIGPWRPARHVWVVNMLGAAVMDFRSADLPPGITELTVFCMLGDVEVIVPLDLQVEFGGLGLIGGFDCESTVGVSDPDAPVLRINGVSCLGGVTVAVRAEGEDVPSRRRRPLPVPPELRGSEGTAQDPGQRGFGRARRPRARPGRPAQGPRRGPTGAGPTLEKP